MEKTLLEACREGRRTNIIGTTSTRLRCKQQRSRRALRNVYSRITTADIATAISWDFFPAKVENLFITKSRIQCLSNDQCR